LPAGSTAAGASTPPGAPGSSAASGGNSVTISTVSTDKGTALSDGNRVLYSFDPDTATSSNCSGSCASTWPPVIGTPSAGSGVDAGALSTITRADGSTQVAYDGHPLYEYAGDKSATDVTGDGVGGIWHVVTVSGSASAASSSSVGYTY
jgi:predicted lipoprotein with Yx(FWY)xxD motif